jgi:alkanesulfonate monooxygenase SsuD/methylene tetrahydromethanopterin reductase-like flavin-dependent oxidoreductase (luciferase family)
MDFGIFNLMGYRKMGPSTADIIKDTVEITRLADEGGIRKAWFAEHHFSNYCVCPSPLMMVGHCAPVTKKIQLTTGILVLPLYDPARLVSEIALADSMCEGRLVVGLGSGYQPFEFERFGKSLDKSKEIAEEIIEMIEIGLSQEFLEYNGKHFKLPKTHISPRTYGGMPEIWMAGDSPSLHRLAARKGFGLITNGRFLNGEKVALRRKEFEQPFLDVGKDPNDLKWGLLRFCCVTDDKAEAMDYAEHVRWNLRLAGSFRRREEVMKGHMVEASKPAPNEPELDEILANHMIGDVETCVERGVDIIRRTNAAHIAIYFQLGTYDNKRAMKSLERFFTHVVPGIEKELGPLSQYPMSTPKRQTAVAV